MATDRFERAKRLFDVALKKNVAERAAYLDGIADLDPELRKEVDSLLASHPQADSFLEKPPLVESVTVTREREGEAEATEARQIGPYRILQEIGHGGMGVVYEAEQEKPVRRRVALKLIKWGMDTKAVIARFESERQALALMNHANIASVYDAGATDQGRPYFAMELVHGEPINEYCDKNRLTIKERLDLFIQVCDGVQHAHQKGIIHRDIKPSNILITIQDDKAVPKIIDFGVAKATSQRLTEKTVYTELGQLIGTPEYMSPEQAEMTGIDIDTRTDVYSLGVVLYELLVGAQPFDPKVLRQASFDDMRRKIREEEPPKPSTRLSRLGEPSTTAAKNRRVELRSLERELRGDLDWITMKVLEKDRTRRYGSPAELAADIRRHVEHEPVLARPPSATYRMRKFVRRHRVGVVAAATVFLAVVIGLAGATMGMVRARRAERRAVAEADKAKAINEFLQEMLNSANPLSSGGDVTILGALDQAVDQIDTSFAGQPEIEAAVRSTIGLTYLRLRRYSEAELLLKRALEIRQRVLGDEHIDTANSIVIMGLLLGEQGKWDEAERFIRDGVRLARELGEPAQGLLGDAMLNLAELSSHRGDFEEAESLLREVLAMWQKEGDDFGVAWVSHNLGGVLSEKGDYEDAESFFRDSLEGFRKTSGDEHPMVASSLYRLGRLMARLNGSIEVQDRDGDCETALPLFEEAIRIRETLGLSSSGYMLESYGKCLTKLARYEEAEQQLVQAHSLLRDAGGIAGKRTVMAVESLVNLYESWGKPEKAAEYRALLEEAAETK